MTTKQHELIVLLDDKGREIGTAPKLASHHLHTPLHKAFSCYVFNDAGRLLVTQRAHSKKVWPGVWTNSLCGHPAPRESYQSAIIRRADYELGMTLTDIATILPDYHYTTPVYKGVIENEFCPVFVAKTQTPLLANLEEVEDSKWLTWDEYVSEIENYPDIYSYWAKDQLAGIRQHPLLERYAENTKLLI